LREFPETVVETCLRETKEETREVLYFSTQHVNTLTISKGWTYPYFTVETDPNRYFALLPILVEFDSTPTLVQRMKKRDVTNWPACYKETMSFAWCTLEEMQRRVDRGEGARGFRFTLESLQDKTSTISKVIESKTNIFRYNGYKDNDQHFNTLSARCGSCGLVVRS
jgi:hypothetical protein